MSNEIVMKCSRELTESEQDQIARLVQVQMAIIEMSLEPSANADHKQAYENVIRLIHGCLAVEYGVELSAGEVANEVQEFRPS